MKKIILLILILIPSLLYARTKITTDHIVIKEGITGKKLGVMRKSDFIKIVNSAERFSKEIAAEENGRVEIILLDSDILTLEEGKVTKVPIEIRWKDEKGNVFKVIETTQKISYKKQKKSIFFRVYVDVAKYGFPVLLSILIILVSI